MKFNLILFFYLIKLVFNQHTDRIKLECPQKCKCTSKLFNCSSNSLNNLFDQSPIDYKFL